MGNVETEVIKAATITFGTMAPNPAKPIDDLVYKFTILKMLKHWDREYQYGALLNDIRDRGWFKADKLPNDLSFEIKWQAEVARQTEEGKYVYVLPQRIMNEEDVQGYVDACHEAYEIPHVLPDHPNLEFLVDLLDVTKVERIALNYALHKSEGYDNGNMTYTIQKVYELPQMKTVETSYKALFDFTDQEMKELANGSLRKSGILVPPYNQYGCFVINKQLSDTFKNKDLSIEYIEQTLFPSSVDTQLSVDDYPHVSAETKRVMSIINRSLETGRAGNNIMLWGGPGTGKTELTLAMAKAQGWRLRVIGDISADDPTEKSRATRIASLKLAQKILARDKRAVLLFDEMEDLFKTDTEAAMSKAFINRIIETSPVPVIWTTNSLQALEHSVLRRMVYNINLESPPAETRAIIWRKYCREQGLRLSQKTITKLAADYEIAPAIIRNAVAVAYAVVGDTKGVRAEREVEEIVANQDRLVRMGETRHIPAEPTENPYDLTCVNSETNVVALTANIIKAKPKWSLCLYGAPGTGKSEYGRHLAKQIGKKLMLKRASDLVSMWVGGTEKNIAAAFAEAAKNQQVLLIDEGDSFLRNREMAKNSWEVTAVNEMLSQMERHTQPFILTTNLMSDLDPASLRRFTFKLKFEYLDPEQAKRLFKQYFGVDAPKEIERNHMIAPGDYANVRGQVDILGVTDPNAIYKMVLAETAMKPQASNGIGF